MFGANLAKIRLVDQVIEEPKVYFGHKLKNALKPFSYLKIDFWGTLSQIRGWLTFSE